jgi:CRISPR-associated endonuclease/helicase Cas3
LIEATYEERENDPPSWCVLFDQWFATASGKRLFADLNSNLWTPALEDQEGVQTRINEVPTLSLVLCRRLAKDDAEFIDGSHAALGGERFCLRAAQAIHRNLVKAPSRYFDFREERAHPGIARYLRDQQAIGIVSPDGAIAIAGLQDGVRMRWSSDLGLTVETTSDKEE